MTQTGLFETDSPKKQPSFAGGEKGGGQTGGEGARNHQKAAGDYLSTPRKKV